MNSVWELSDGLADVAEVAAGDGSAVYGNGWAEVSRSTRLTWAARRSTFAGESLWANALVVSCGENWKAARMADGSVCAMSPIASGSSLVGFVSDCVEPGSLVHTDGWRGIPGLEESRSTATGFYPHGGRLRGWQPRNSRHVHLVASLLKRWLAATSPREGG